LVVNDSDASELEPCSFQQELLDQQWMFRGPAIQTANQKRQFSFAAEGTNLENLAAAFA